MLTEAIPTSPIQKAINRSDTYEEKAATVIKKYTMISGGAALAPYDFVDVVTSTVCQTMMVKELCAIYDVPFSEKMFNVAFWSATGSVVVKVISSAVKKIIHTIDNNKSIDLTGAAVAGIFTATVGEFYKLHLREGGTLENIEIADFGNYFIEEIKRGDISLATFTNPKALMSHLNII